MTTLDAAVSAAQTDLTASAGLLRFLGLDGQFRQLVTRSTQWTALETICSSS
jgi:hypothetical protein